MREKIKAPIQKIKVYNQYRWFRWLWRTVVVLVLFVMVSYIGMAWYINHNKPALLKSLTETLSEGLNGTVTIRDMEPAFLVGFPSISLRLRNVVVRDSLFNIHKRTLLNAEDFNISVNALALVRGTIDINRIKISNANVDLYTNSAGYSNSAIFPKKEAKSSATSSYPRLNRFSLVNVRFKIDNQHKKKLFNFMVNDLTGKLKYRNSGWDASMNLDTDVNSMAFSTSKGSFALKKNVSGEIDTNYDESTGIVTVAPAKLKIGSDDFVVSAAFGSLKNPEYFGINIRAKEILWRNASALLSPNISSRLNLFELDEPIKVGCDITGDFSVEGDPLITVRADVLKNQLHTAGGSFNACNFVGYFTNSFDKSLGNNDKNSAITIANFTADYSGIPIKIKKARILDLENPIAVGDFSTTFAVEKLCNIIDKDLIAFTNGIANVTLDFAADIVNYELSKPLVEGTITIKDASAQYVPRKLKFDNVDVEMLFKNDDLIIPQFDLESGKSVVKMKGRVDNFLNLYYSEPEKIILEWDVKSPQLHVSEFLGFLGTRQTKIKTVETKGNFTKELDLLFDKSNVDMDLAVERVIYNKFLATNLSTNVVLSQSGIFVQNGVVNHADGKINFSGSMAPSGNSNNFKMNTKIKDVNIAKFFTSFNNFSLESLTAANLRGNASVDAKLSGKILDSGILLENSLNGSVAFNLKKGALVNFDAIRDVGKFAFPFRNFDEISIYDLKGNLKIGGEKIFVEPMKISSSVLNMNLEGVYSFGRGTELYVNVPLRNPKKDKDIESKEELAERRMRGIVINLIAKDDDNGTVKLSLGKKSSE